MERGSAALALRGLVEGEPAAQGFLDERVEAGDQPGRFQAAAAILTAHFEHVGHCLSLHYATAGVGRDSRYVVTPASEIEGYRRAISNAVAPAAKAANRLALRHARLAW